MSALDDIYNGIKSSPIGAQLMRASTLRTVREGAYDPSNPTMGPAKTTTDYACRALAVHYTSKFKPPTEARSNDFAAIILMSSPAIEAAGVTPMPGDHLLVPPPGSPARAPIEMKIVRLRDIDPAGCIATVDLKAP